MLNEISQLTILGLVWDIAGVLMLAVGLLGVTRRDMEWAQTWDGSGYLAGTRLIERTDAMFGVATLVVGFVFQIGGTLKISTSLWGIWLGVGLLFSVLIAHQMKRQQIRGLFGGGPPSDLGD